MILYLNPFTGLAGDMLLGALLSAGASTEAVRRAVARTGLTGWHIETEDVRTGALMAVRVRIDVDDDATERPAATLIEMAARTDLTVAVRALKAIAEVEGALHGVPAADVHLHELGGHDTLIDIVGCAAALADLDVTQVYCAPLPLGGGSVETRHGVLPVPAPATLALLKGAQVRGGGEQESVTPTGAAILRAAETLYGAAPPMEVRAVGYGAGSRQLADRPNVTVAVLGRPVTSPDHQVILSTNLDDVTGELLGHVLQRALQAGAADAWITPAIMKKGRPAHILHVLAPIEMADRLENLLFAETGTLGLRRSQVEKVMLPRSVRTVELYGQSVRMKQGPWGVKPEYDDLARLAASTGKPLLLLTREALEAL
ncbi:nickel pincer cofactor biosynthesis protein LarC [Herbidospora mongoliensis]|uniref:nickel pincer cofactor biosynthesis protein LarC n=1 Tax=Herbidospora mongoliensis TaxID=688067 RepID=UPI000832EA64|nr:nickel pincer cofactor biosynthesis protein LarC [Herbidospora mongoliensis]